MNLKSNGKEGVDEKYLNEDGEVIVEISPQYFRPAEVDLLQANSSKAQKSLGWEPRINFKELVRLMTEHDLKIAEKEAFLKNKK
jgi:GDPmannose 4,6-dehydratase